MADDSKEAIGILYKKVQGAKKASRDRKALISKREELQQVLQGMYDDLSEATLAHHKNHGSDPTAIEQQRATLKELQKQQQQLDHRIDDLEDKECCGRLYRQLVDLVLEAHASERHIYERLVEERDAFAERCLHLERLIREGENASESLATAIACRESARQQSILAYVIGPSPRAVVSHHVQAGARFSERILDAGQVSVHADDSAAIAPLLECAGSIIARNEERWGLRAFDKVFPPLAESLEACLAAIDAYTAAIVGQRDAAGEAMEAWIRERAQ